MKELKALNKYFYKYRWKLLPGVFFVMISNIFSVLPAQIIRIAFDLVTENIALYKLFTGFSRQDLILKIFASSVLFFGMLVLAMALLRGAFLFFMRQTIILTSRHIEYDQKNEIYSHYQDLSLAFYRRNHTGDLMNRVTEDVSRVRMYFGPAFMYTINTIVLFVMVIVAMLSVNVKLTLLSLFPLPFLAFTIYYVNNIINEKSEKIQERLSDLSSFVQENLSGIRVIKSYVKEKPVKDRFALESDYYRRDAMGLVKVQALFYPLMLLMVGLSTIITIYVGGVEVMNGKITSGNIAEFIFYVNLLTFPVTALGWVTSLVQRAAASQKRINEFLNTPSEISDHNKEAKIINGDISFKNVSFIYPDTGIKALKNISFEVKAGEFLAIVGRTGSGKSTIANLILRMYDAVEGEIFIDGKNIKQYNLQDYRSQAAFVPQEVFLFSDTIANNIAFGMDKLNMKAVEDAAKNAAVYKNITAFEKGFNTLIGERGVTLSGGQKQRVSIARAIAKQPQIIIFDDCLSAVDTKTEEEILSNLGKVMKGKTSILIAHRVSTIKNADHIIVMQDGEIAEYGNHDNLILKAGIYNDLYEQQLLEEQELN